MNTGLLIYVGFCLGGFGCVVAFLDLVLVADSAGCVWVVLVVCLIAGVGWLPAGCLRDAH